MYLPQLVYICFGIELNYQLNHLLVCDIFQLQNQVSVPDNENGLVEAFFSESIFNVRSFFYKNQEIWTEAGCFLIFFVYEAELFLNFSSHFTKITDTDKLTMFSSFVKMSGSETLV